MPRCGDCQRLNLPCRWPSDHQSSRAGSRHAPSSVSAASETPEVLSPQTTSSDEGRSSVEELPVVSSRGSRSLGMRLSPNCSWNPHLQTSEDRSLFNHYVHIVARALSRSSDLDGNPFIATLLPIAATSDTVTNVILGLSGGHWRRVYPNIWNRALTRQGKALSQINRLLTLSDPRSTFEACTAVLLLCLTELFDGTSRVWKWHLKAASAILKSLPMDSLASKSEWNFCISLFHYLDAMSTISSCKPPLLHSDSTIEDFTALLASRTPPEPLPESKGSIDAIYGISPALFDFLGMVNLLADHRNRRVDELSEIGFRTAAAHLESQVDSWRSNQDHITDTPLTGPAKEVAAATTAFEWAIRLRLHQIVEGYDPSHEKVESSIQRILAAVLEIPYGSKVEGCLLFPLVIAGASSTDMERRMFVKERLMVLENTLGFRHIQYARPLLETVWEDEPYGEGSGRGPNWAYVRYSRFPGVVFV
ncbi:hypothetical protein MPDQ_004761 [Monascus purpureus]|uniref:Zn(2)-C6 fungal-type domain-containing protein n=1 Tax=Monascus purpureus TaxID=5098 RepID=A0A507QZY1_MONPU|nr:hypothetical protein MPDQ_004761 [Monascus purpureus]